MKRMNFAFDKNFCKIHKRFLKKVTNFLFWVWWLTCDHKSNAINFYWNTASFTAKPSHAGWHPPPFFLPNFLNNFIGVLHIIISVWKKEKSTHQKRVEMIRRKSILYLGSCDSTPPASSVRPTSWPTVDIRYISIQCFWRWC